MAGSEEKCRYVVDTLGFDACINYKADDLNQALRAACLTGLISILKTLAAESHFSWPNCSTKAQESPFVAARRSIIKEMRLTPQARWHFSLLYPKPL
nr:hypothetical protein KXZ65_16100 [Pectobacterium sp. PL152]